jgi:hypothetical protein
MSTNGKERREAPVYVHRIGMQVVIGWGCSFKVRRRQRGRSMGGSPGRRAAVDGAKGGQTTAVIRRQSTVTQNSRACRPASISTRCPESIAVLPLENTAPGNHQLGLRARSRTHWPVHAVLAPPVPARWSPRLLSVVPPGTRTSAGRR